MIDPILIEDKDTGHVYPIPSELFNSDAHKKLDRPALDAHGDPAPVKYRSSVAALAAEKKAAKSVDQNKEN